MAICLDEEEKNRKESLKSKRKRKCWVHEVGKKETKKENLIRFYTSSVGRRHKILPILLNAHVYIQSVVIQATREFIEADLQFRKLHAFARIQLIALRV